MLPSQLPKDEVLTLLSTGLITMEGQIPIGSNYVFLVSLKQGNSRVQAVYKPQKGEIPLWDFPAATLANRETAAYLLSEALKWNFVPPTVIRENGPFGRGSLQLFIPHNPHLNYFTFPINVKEKLRASAVFDLVINNADRKGSHILLGDKGKIWLIDHGISFHKISKLRTVIWDFIGESIPASIIHDLEELLGKLAPDTNLSHLIRLLISNDELSALIDRIEGVIHTPIFPEPGRDSRPFPFPMV